MIKKSASCYSRRRFLIGCVGSMAGLACCKLVIKGKASGEFFLGFESAKKIGEKYSEQLGDVPELPRILDSVFRGVSEERRVRILRSQEEFSDFVLVKGLADFKAGRVVNVDGFFLSSTEANVCLLASSGVI